MLNMKNWAGNVDLQSNQIVYPSTESEIQQAIINAANQRQQVRVIGTGHSFSALCQTKDVLLSLDKYQGLIAVDKDQCLATVKAGTKLKLLGELLWKEGLAMENMGDIDAQSIAGTISTGTHGTGTSFGTISTQIVALKIINAHGEIKRCSPTENPNLFKAAQVSLGALGVITEITLRCIPSYKLLIKNRKEKLTSVLDSIAERNEQNRNFEYYWFPYTDTVWTKTTNVAESGDPDKDSYFNYLSELLVENYSFKAICEWARMFPSQNKMVAKLSAQSVPTVDKLNFSHRVFATMRLVKFKEMEYNVPADAYQDVMKEVVKLVNSKNYNIHFPIENRWVKEDDIYMSPAYGRKSAYIACHVYHKKDGTAYFGDLETIFKKYDGRPHWGKIHTLTGEDVRDRYPMFDAFNTLRKKEDPDGMFLNPHLKRIFA